MNAHIGGRRRPADRHRRRHRADVRRHHQGPSRTRARRGHAATSSRCGASRCSTSASGPWTMCKWDEYGGLFVTFPGGKPGEALVRRAPTSRPARGAGSSARTRHASSKCAAMCSSAPRRQHHAGRSHRLRQRHAVHRDAGRRLGSVSVAIADHHLAAGPRVASRRVQEEPFQPQLAGTTDYVRHVAAATSGRAGSRRARPLGRRAVGRRANGTPAAARPPVVRNTGWVSIGSPASPTRL